jgi:membrane dipeptidase
MKIKLLLLLFACCTSALFAQNTDVALREKADKLAHQFMIVDGHVDLPYRLKVQNFRLERHYIDSLVIATDSKTGNFDYVRAKKGGLSVPFMSIYIPANLQKTGREKRLADSLIDMIQGLIKANPEKFAEGRTPQYVEENFKKGLISMPMGMENGAPIIELSDVAYFYKRGIRYITLTHGKDNHICDSSYDTTRTWGGLSAYGREVVAEMNRVGVMVDISHVSDDAFWAVMDLTKKPCIASHSSCRFFTPEFKRNMSDSMIQRLGRNNGVIQINFGTSFLDEKARKDIDTKQKDLVKMLEQKGLRGDDKAAKPFIEKFQLDNPILFADVEKVADHIDHVRQLVGVDHIGIGSDFDGVGDTLPTGLKDVSQYPNLIFVLLKRGYSDDDIEKICYKNVWRVWNEVEKK